MELLSISIRTVILYIAIVIIFRLMGKREIGELSILDLVVFIMIAEMAVMAIENTDDPIFHTILPMVILLIIQIVLAIISLRSQRVREWVDGKPTIIIDNGKINETEMKKQRYNFNDLMTQLREKDIKNMADVEFAILEPSGKLSVFKKDTKQSKKKTPSLNLPFILDGEVQHHHLEREHRTVEWLQKELAQRGYYSLSRISYCSFDQGTFYIDTKDED